MISVSASVDMEPSSTTAKVKSGGLAKRVLSALVILPVALLAVWQGTWFFAAFLVLLAILGAFEWVAISGESRRLPGFILAASVVGAAFATFHFPLAWGLVSLGVAFLLGIGSSFKSGSKTSFLIGFGAVYMAAAFYGAWYLRQGNHGVEVFLWLCAMVVATDVGAYVSGKSIGGPKLAPSISPNKTWAGLIGGMTAAALASLAFMAVTTNSVISLLLIGAATAVIAQAGDLLESWMKRCSGLKDSSHLIPGHGGVLDRIDGFLAATLWLFLITSVFGIGLEFHGA